MSTASDQSEPRTTYIAQACSKQMQKGDIYQHMLHIGLKHCTLGRADQTPAFSCPIHLTMRCKNLHRLFLSNMIYANDLWTGGLRIDLTWPRWETLLLFLYLCVSGAWVIVGLPELTHTSTQGTQTQACRNRWLTGTCWGTVLRGGLVFSCWTE